MSDSQFWFAILMGAAMTGGAMGLFPLVVGLILNRRTLAASGFFATLVAGLVLGIIAAFPMALVFTTLIARDVKKERKSKDEVYSY